MHGDGRVVLPDLRDGFDQTCRQIELAALSVAGQVGASVEHILGTIEARIASRVGIALATSQSEACLSD